MDWKLELVPVPVTDADRTKAFSIELVGFQADHDHQVNDALRFVQLTPPGSACSIMLGTGITKMPPGAQQCLQVRRQRCRDRSPGADRARRGGQRDRRPALGLLCHLQ